MRSAVVILAACLAAQVTDPATADVYVIRPDGTGDFPTIQAAIDAAADGDVIELTDGTFTGTGNRDIDLLGKDLTVRSQNGSPDGCILDCEATPSDPHRGFCLHSGESLQATLCGIRIRNGDQEYQNGGGLCCYAASITIVDCIFENCRGGGGGGVCAWYGSLVLQRCEFRGNQATQGGGVFFLVEEPGQSLTVLDCRFQDNQAGGVGGGIDFRYQADATIAGCVFQGNHAYRGGGLACDNMNASIATCVFRDNSANVAGGGLWCSGAGTSIRVTACTFDGNHAGRGGAVTCQSMPYYDSEPVFEECAFFFNTASERGVLSFTESSPLLDRCTVSHNADDSHLGQVYLDDSHAELSNTLIACAWDGCSIRCAGTSTASLYCCDVYGNPGGDWIGCLTGQLGINGNISEDPLFCDQENGDFTIRSDSPCAPFTPPNEECDLIGAWPVGCDAPVSVESITWGAIKSGYR